MKIEAVTKFMARLPEVTVNLKWNTPTWVFGKTTIAWLRPFSKADIKRFGDQSPPTGDILAVKVKNLAAKDELLTTGIPGFFTIPHFNEYPAVLVELRIANTKDVQRVIQAAYQLSIKSSAEKGNKQPLTKVVRRKRVKT